MTVPAPYKSSQGQSDQWLGPYVLSRGSQRTLVLSLSSASSPEHHATEEDAAKGHRKTPSAVSGAVEMKQTRLVLCREARS
jgi:hypothetical protein